jgi:hypothetical protein
MQKIDRKMLDLIVEAQRLRGNSGLRWQGHDQRTEPQSDVRSELSDAGSEKAQPIAGVRQTYFA